MRDGIYPKAADRVVLEATNPAHLARARRHYRRNFTSLLIDGAFFGVTLSFVSEQTIVPLFVKQLTGSSWVTGLVAAMRFLGFLGPQLVASHWVYSRKRKKPFVWLVAVGERLALVLLLGILAQWGRWPEGLLLTAFLACYGFFYLTIGVIQPGYQDLIAKNIVHGRGLLIGSNRALAGVMVLGSSFMVSWAIRDHPFPQEFILIFAIALAFSVPSILALSAFRETPYEEAPPSRSLATYLREVPEALRMQPLFRKYLLLRCLLAIASMGTSFVVVYVVSDKGYDPATIGSFTAVMIGAQYFGALTAGWTGDRLGYKRVLQVAALALGGAYALILSGYSAPLVYGSFLLAGLSMGAFQVSDPNLALELSPPRETPRFVGIANTVLMPASAAGPVLAGILVETTTFPLMFSFALALTLIAAALVVLEFREPRSIVPERGSL